MPKENNSNQIVITRIYNAPVEVVWKAWTDVEQVSKWWGPRGFTITTHSKDLKPGGHWNYTMHGPDGVDYPNKTKYFEVIENSLLVYDHGANDNQPPLFRVRVEFIDQKNKTKMLMTMTLESAAKKAEVEKIIKSANGNSTWDRLGEYVEKISSGKEKFIINRSFSAPQALVFKLWTDPDHIKQWLSPTGTEMQYIKADVREGGSAMYVMFGADYKLYGKCQYKKIKAPELIIYTQQFCDESGKTTRHPMAPVWPESMLTTVTFSAETETSTRLTIEWEIDGEYTEKELEAFILARGGMTQGWTGSLDKFEVYLSARS